jgi:Reverse transcriptase (RNA-dependent DNA polymerase)
MENSLLSPAQLWDHGVTLDVVPKQYSDGQSIHGIHHPDENIHIPFHLHGCISYFCTRLPSKEEINNCRWITFTSEREWNPYSDHFADSERAMIRHHDHFDPRYLHFDRNGNQLDGRTFGAVYTSHFSPTNTSSHYSDPAIDTFDVVYNMTNSRMIHATSSTEHRCNVPNETLARRWGTSLQTAKETIACTTQQGLRATQGELTRPFRTRQKQLENRYLNTKMYTDTLFMSTPSARGSTCFQLFVTSEGFVAGKPLKSKADAYEVLEYVCRKYGVPKLLVSDGAREELLGNWGRVVKQNLIRQRITEPHSGWQNRCEDEIRELRKHYARIMALHNCPDAFWDFAFDYVVHLRQFLSRNASNQRSPIEAISGDSPDISEFLEFDFYQWVKYRDPTADKERPVKLGRWLGIASDVGTPLTYWILKDNTQVVARSTVRPYRQDEYKSETEADTRRQFDIKIKDKCGDYDPQLIYVFENEEMEQPIMSNDTPLFRGDEEIQRDEGVGDNQDNRETITGESEIINSNNKYRKINEGNDHTNNNTCTNDLVNGPDTLKGAQVILPRGDHNEIAKVLGRKKNSNRNYIGRAHRNPILDSRIFRVQFSDGDEKDIMYNMLAEHLFSQVDAEGNQYRLFKEIINHRKKDNAIGKEDQFRITKDGRRIQKKTVTGWDIEVEWKDGSTSWLPLKEVKETNAVEVAEYAKNNRIIEEPAFAWWAPEVLRKKVRLIKLSKSRHSRRGFIFGIRVPTTVEEAIMYDKENGDTQWCDAIMKEMGNVRIAFEPVEKPPPGYKKVDLILIFDIKMDFTRKARLVARGDMTDTPPTLTYSSVVSRESVRIAFLIAALNELDVIMFDVGNAYLNAPTTEKLYCIAGKEFGPDEEGMTMKICRALYGLKSSGAAYRAHFAATLTELGYTSSRADPDVWMRPAVKPNGFEYYEYLLTYVDDCLILSHNPKQITQSIETEYKYRLKDVGEPTRYLGAEIGKYSFSDNLQSWYMSAKTYLQRAIIEVERKWGTVSKLFPRQHLDIPMQPGTHPELDITKYLDDDDTQLYQSYIGILRWAVELGRIDLAHSAGVMARFAAAPRQGHLYQVLHIFAYCKKHLESKVVFDQKANDFSHIEWVNHDWKQFYPELDGEALPVGRPQERGRAVQINLFCDAAHATCHLTRRSTTGIIFFINGAPIIWYSKRQNTIESSTFGSEFVALKIAIEMNEAIRYKLRMFGIPIDGETNCFCDNKSVVTNAIVPQSTLHKKHNYVAYHKVRESVAMQAVRIAHEPGKFNLSDVLTKFLGAPNFKRCIQCILMQ